ncbi:MAG: TetR/AcrR family transcriptional regulator [Ilumatobacteraceae bacterium]|nr:TetR/AcrR family transcriptional regulator [Ilumatobacteraceae bacterium]
MLSSISKCVTLGVVSTDSATSSRGGGKLRTARERAREEITNEITAVARRQLAEVGASALSLRSVAREVGMVSSAVYRYFPSRDELLTQLIIDAYRSVGDAARTAVEAAVQHDLRARWQAVAGAVRAWALANPHEFGLIFGTPVPGYRAPVDTVDPAAAVPTALLQILVDSLARGGRVAWGDRPVPPVLHAELTELRAGLSGVLHGSELLDDGALSQGLMAWTQLIGMISFELFGHLHNVIADHDVYFTHQIGNIAIDLGLAE